MLCAGWLTGMKKMIHTNLGHDVHTAIFQCHLHDISDRPGFSQHHRQKLTSDTGTHIVTTFGSPLES
eukprot:755109-Hanusia_phi.AAC.7